MKSAVAAFAVAFAAVPAFAARVENLRIPGQYENLAAILTMPDNVTSNIPVVIFCHGFLSHKNGAIAVKLTEQLVPNGIATLRFDFTGHGDNDHAMFPKMTVPNEIADTINVYNYLRTRPEFGKIALGGHSQGGVVAAMTAGQLGADKISGLAIWAAASVLKDDAISAIELQCGGSMRMVARDIETSLNVRVLYTEPGEHQIPYIVRQNLELNDT